MTEEMELYIHIPFCVKKCSYCDFLSGPADTSVQHAYTLALCRELEFFGAQARKKREHLRSVFIGGGTPSWLDAADMERILLTLRKNFDLGPETEFTLECNPGTVTREKLLMYKKYGVNRLSIGMQSADEKELQLLGRIHTFAQFLKTFQMARELHFNNINVDVMTGLPYQNWETLKKTLEKTVRLAPEHISAYGLMIEEGTPFYQMYAQDVKRRERGEATVALPDEDAELELLKKTRDFLKSRGYVQYEISNFAKKGRNCRHNMGYWERVPYLGCGIGAASFLDGKRCGNVTDINEYIRRCGQLGNGADAGDAGQRYDSPLWESCEALSVQDAMAEFMFLGLRLREGVSRIRFGQTFGMSVETVYGKALEKLEQEELLVCENDRIFLTERGMDVSNIALAEFLI